MASPAHDGFETYFAEKIWQLVPLVHRKEDGEEPDPNTLWSLVQVIARQAAVLRRSQDRLWDDVMIDLCDDWAVSYIGDLVGTRLVPSSREMREEVDPALVGEIPRDANARGRRVDVAKTVYYRRRKGTPRVLEELIGDITGWEGKVVEQFKRLARPYHGLDPHPALGPRSGTPRGGIADLRNPVAASWIAGPFDEYHHVADVRRHRDPQGRYAIQKLAFHLYRLLPQRWAQLPLIPGPVPNSFFVDPRKRDMPLFAQRDRREVWYDWREASPWEVPAPIARPLLGHAEYRIASTLGGELQDEVSISNAARKGLEKLSGLRIPSESHLRSLIASLPNGDTLLDPPVFARILARSLSSDCGKAQLLGGSRAGGPAIEVLADGLPIPVHEVVAADLSESWHEPPEGKRVAVDPETGRLRLRDDDPVSELRLRCFYATVGPIGAGTDARPGLDAPDEVAPDDGSAFDLLKTGVFAFPDSDHFSLPSLTRAGEVQPDGSRRRDLTVQAANGARPYFDLAGDWVIRPSANVDAAELVLDGLWLGGSGDVVLRGDFASVAVRRCTLDPGNAGPGGPSPVSLVVEGTVRELSVKGSIAGRIRTRGGDAFVGELRVLDSIIQAHETLGDDLAIELPESRVVIRRSTTMGGVLAQLLDASELLVDGRVTAINAQDGCFRFSAAHEGSRPPHPFESVVLDPDKALFTSRDFADPAYGQLSRVAPPAVLRGGENAAEIGAFNGLVAAVKLDSLRIKVDEYAPFGLIPLTIFET